MNYTKNTWASGDIVTSEKLNHMEDGIAAAGDIITDATNMADMTDTEKLYRYNGSIYYYNGTAWVAQKNSGDSDFFVVEVTTDWWAEGHPTTANCTWSELTATTKLILWNGQIAQVHNDLSGGRIAYIAPFSGSSYQIHELVFEATGYTVTENVFTIDTATDIMRSTLNIAPLYSVYLTYNVGDLVIYNNTLYRCTTAVSTPESFDSSKWEFTTIASVTDELGNSGNGSSSPVGILIVSIHGADDNMGGTAWAYDSGYSYNDISTAVQNNIPVIIMTNSYITTSGKILYPKCYVYGGQLSGGFYTFYSLSSNYTGPINFDRLLVDQYGIYLQESSTILAEDYWVSRVASMIAPQYSEGTTYAVGDLMHLDQSGQCSLYKCNTTINSPEAFNSDHWTLTTIAEVIAAL